MPSEYEREIDEILRRMDEVSPRRSLRFRASRWVRLRWQALAGWVRGLPTALPADQLMVGALVCGVAFVIMRSLAPGLAIWIGLAAVVMFVAAFAISIGRVSGSSRNEVRWRGKVIDMRSGQPTVADRIILWLRRQFKR